MQQEEQHYKETERGDLSNRQERPYLIWVVLLVYVVLTLIMTWPAVTVLSSSVIGEGGDPWQTMWRFEDRWRFAQHSWEEGTLLAFIRYEFFGGGEARLVNLSVWPWMWLHVLVGQPLTYNLIWFISFISAGLGMFVLVKAIVEHYRQQRPEFVIGGQPMFGAFLAGLMYMFAPYHVAHAAGHFGALQVQWLPWILWLGFLLWKKTTVWRLVGLGLLIIIQAWSEHHYMLWLTVFLVMLPLLWSPLRQRFASRIRLPFIMFGVVVVSVLLLSYGPTIRLAMTPSTPLVLGADQTIRFSADLFAYITPASFHPLWGGLTEALFSQHFTGNVAEATHYLGVVGLLLLLFFHGRVPREEWRRWLLVAGVFLLIALGPRLHILGRVLPFPLPYALIDDWPVWSSVRAVGRASVMLTLSLAVLVGWIGATHIRRRGIIALLAGLLLLDFLFWPVASQAVTLSPAYNVVKKLPGETIIEIPAATNYTAASRALYASGYHDKKVIGSIALERAEGAQAQVRSLPALRQLLYLRTSHVRLDRPDFFSQPLPETLLEVMDWLDSGAILVHKDSLSVLQVATIRNFLERDVGLSPQDFGDVLLYEIPGSPSKSLDGVFLSRDSGWQSVRFDEMTNQTLAVVPESAGITLYNASSHMRRVLLRFSLASESDSKVVVYREDKQELPVQMVNKRDRVIDVTLAPGTLDLRFVNEGTEPVTITNPVLEVAP